MVNIKEVANKVYRLETSIPGMDTIFATYLIQESDVVLIEPGPTAAIPSIQEGMKQLGMEDLVYIIPTHIHMDHAGSIGTLAQLFPGAKVLVPLTHLASLMAPKWSLVRTSRLALDLSFLSKNPRYWSPRMAR